MRKSIPELALAIVTSSIFCILLVKQVMAGGVGESISFSEFLSEPASILFCFLMSLFIFASWLMKGINNRTVLLCWAAMLVVYSLIFWWIYSYFYYESINIYMLILARLASSLPVVIIIRYRVLISLLLLNQIHRAGLATKQINSYGRHIQSTDFEVNMEMVLYTAFFVEILYSLYMVSYGLVNGIPYNGSITEHLAQNNVWDPYYLHYWLINLVTLAYILVITWYLYRDNNNPDAYLHGFSQEETRAASLKVLEKYRQKAKNKEKNRRD